MEKIEDKPLMKRVGFLQELLTGLVEDISQQQTLSIALEGTLSAVNHKALLDKESSLQEKECVCIHSVCAAHLKYRRLVNELWSANVHLLTTYEHAITELDHIKQIRLGLHSDYLAIAKDQTRLAYGSKNENNKAANDKPLAYKSMGKHDEVCSVNKEIDATNPAVNKWVGDVVLEKPNLADFALSEELRLRLENKPEQQKAEDLTLTGLSKNPFENASTIMVTPGLFGSAAKTPSTAARDVSESVEKFRTELQGLKEKLAETESNNVKRSVGQCEPKSGGGKSEEKGLKHSKGSLNGSLIENSGNQSLIVPFEGKIPIDLSVNDDETHLYNMTTRSSVRQQDPVQLLSERKPVLPKLYASDLYNAVRLVGPHCEGRSDVAEKNFNREGSHSSMATLHPQAKESLKPPEMPRLFAVDLSHPTRPVLDGERGILKPPEMPKLYAADLYEASRITSSERPIRFGGAFKPVYPKNKRAVAEEKDTSYEFPKMLEAYRQPASSNETFTVKDEKRVLMETSNVGQKRASIKPFTDEEYAGFTCAIHEKLSLDKLNSAVNILNLYLETGPRAFTRKDIQKIVSKELDRCQALLFSSVLSESGRMERLKPASVSDNFDTTIFATYR